MPKRYQMLLVFIFPTLLILTGCGSMPSKPQLSDQDIHRLIHHTSSNKNTDTAWAYSISHALSDMEREVNKSNSCAVIAIVDQESSFSVDPRVAGISNILQRKLDAAGDNLFMKKLIALRLNSQADNGKTFKQNIATIRTEKQMGDWYSEFTASAVTKPILKLISKDLDSLISTIGSMQVSVDFSRDYAKAHGKDSSNMRQQLFTMDGGIYYGTAHLLDGGQQYNDMVYYFADFNAGHFASRNAGFQRMVSRLSGIDLVQDGDLLIYRNGKPDTHSQSYRATVSAIKKHRKILPNTQIQKDFLLSPRAKFSDSPTYLEISDLYQARHGSVIEASIPNIRLKSDKISRKLTTKWFANKVKQRYNKCMKYAL